ncbi:MAG: hypothetical protein KJ726_04815 [Verrucomicrobia bacterium]|nr:hypothetical protein [Verrucomicrobiota bacterium]MBU1909351.1 hypothetical protein [Verrucomicrobiota bacterium]
MLVIWAESSYTNKAKAPDGSFLPTNAVVQLLGSRGAPAMGPDLNFGYLQGVETNWSVEDTARVPKPGFIIGYDPNITNAVKRCVVRVLLPSGPYMGDGYSIPNPTVSNGLWIAQTGMYDPDVFEFKFHIDATNWLFIALDPQQDSDGDGLTDRWEWWNFNNPTNALPGDDPDGDTAPNFSEQAACTDPNDSNSFLRVEGLPVSESEGGVRISWWAQSNVSYGVDFSTGLVEDAWSFINLFSNIVLPDTSLFVTNIPGISERAVYRLVVYPAGP